MTNSKTENIHFVSSLFSKKSHFYIQQTLTNNNSAVALLLVSYPNNLEYNNRAWAEIQRKHKIQT